VEARKTCNAGRHPRLLRNLCNENARKNNGSQLQSRYITVGVANDSAHRRGDLHVNLSARTKFGSHCQEECTFIQGKTEYWGNKRLSFSFLIACHDSRQSSSR